jgi:hypothetical protein
MDSTIFRFDLWRFFAIPKQLPFVKNIAEACIVDQPLEL